MLWVAPWRLFEQVAAAFIRDAWSFGRNETAYCIGISEENTGLQLLLRQQSSTWLKRQGPSVLYERLVVCRGQPPHSCVTLVGAVFSTIAYALARDETVVIAGFGKFDVRTRAARTGRNPQTGATVAIAASRVPSFKPAKALRDAVNE